MFEKATWRVPNALKSTQLKATLLLRSYGSTFFATAPVCWQLLHTHAIFTLLILLWLYLMHWFFTQSSQYFVFGTFPSTRILWKDPAVLLEILATWRERSIWPKNFGFFKKKLTFRCYYHHWKNTSAFYKVKQTASSNIWFEHSNVIAVFYSHCQCRVHRDRHHTSVHNVCCSSFQESMDPNMRSCEAIDSEFS
jgi:hypothetical protein